MCIDRVLRHKVANAGFAERSVTFDLHGFVIKA